MDFIWEGFREGVSLLARGDADTWFAIALSLWTSVLAIAAAAALAVPLGTHLGLFRPRGTALCVGAFRVGMSFPTVVIGLLLFGLLSRRGPLSGLGLLYTPWVIVVGEVLLAFPILASFAHAAAAGLDPRAKETVVTHGGGRSLARRLAVLETRPLLVTSLLSAFGRCVTELGIVTTAGGSLRFVTRTLPAQTQLEVSRGEFGRAMAAGMMLVLLACGAALAGYLVDRRGER